MGLQPGDLVRIDSPRTPHHGQIGLIIGVDKLQARWPSDRIYYSVLLPNQIIMKYRYEQLIFSTDGYFENNDYFSSR